MPSLVEKAHRKGVTIALENTWDDRPEVLLHLKALLPERNNVMFCLDTGHLNVYSQLPLRRWWRCLGDDISAIHLHDNDGLSDDHLPPGRGTVDFETLVELLLDMRRMPLLDLEVDHPRGNKRRAGHMGCFIVLFNLLGCRYLISGASQAPENFLQLQNALSFIDPAEEPDLHLLIWKC